MDADWLLSRMVNLNELFLEKKSTEDLINCHAKKGQLEVWNINDSVPKNKGDEGVLSQRYAKSWGSEQTPALLYFEVRKKSTTCGVIHRTHSRSGRIHSLTHYNSLWTRNFYVYEFDFDSEKWVLVEILGNVALLLGVNESISPNIVENDVEEGGGLKKNSINFMDDFWDNKPYKYELVWSGVNHDCVILNL